MSLSIEYFNPVLGNEFRKCVKDNSLKTDIYVVRYEYQDVRPKVVVSAKSSGVGVTNPDEV